MPPNPLSNSSTPGKHAENSASGVGSGAASAPARAREVESVSSTLSQTKSGAFTKDKVSSIPSKPETAEISVASQSASAAEAELPTAKTSAKSSGGSKKTILGAAAVVLIAAGGYEVWIQGGQLGIWGEPARTTATPAHAPAQSVTTHAAPEAASIPAGALSGSTSTTKPTPSVAANASSIPAAGVATPPVPQPMNVSPEISQALLLKKTQPAYPPNALPSHLEGAVKLSATISPAGDVSAVKVVSGDPLLAPAAVDAVKQWKYKPYVLSGTPIAIQTPVTVNFKAPK
jgi:TonB family protein